MHLTYQPIHKIAQKKISIAIAVIFSGTIVVTSVAQGAGFALREQSAYAQGNSFAGVAAGGAISTSFWNPANTAEVGEGIEYEAMLSLIDAKTEIETTGNSNVIYRDLNDTGDISNFSVLPAGYFAKRMNDKTAWGVSFTVPYGLGSEADRGSKSQYVALKTEAKSLNVTPTITYETSPGFNLGLGLQLQKFDVTLSQALPVGAAVGRFSANDPVLDISGDDSSLGFTLGFNYQNDKTAFGVGYRSSIDHELKGKFNVAALGLDAPVSVDLETPSLINVGIKHKVNNKWTLGATYEKTNWSSVGTIPVVSDQTGSAIVFNGRSIALPFEYKDTAFTSVGVDYGYSNKTVLRVGIGLDETVTSDNTRTTRLADNDRYWLSFGATHKLAKNSQVDWGFTHILLKDEAPINIVPGHLGFIGLPYTGNADPTVNILSVSYKRNF